MICQWSNPEGSLPCKNSVFDSTGYCLLHKKNKNPNESTLFWNVVNLNYFRHLSDKSKQFLSHVIMFDDEAVKIYPEIEQVMGHGIISLKLSKNETIRFGEELRLARDTEKRHLLFNKLPAEEIFALYDNYQLHNGIAGFISGWYFPKNFRNFERVFIGASMSNAGWIEFNDCKFESAAIIERREFQWPVRFIDCKFNHAISFENSIFHKAVKFTNCKLQTVNGFEGKYTFKNAEFKGEVLQFTKGSICTLYGIKLSEDTDLIIDDDVEIPTHDRYEFTIGYKKNIYNENAFIAKRQAERTGNISLLLKYEELLKKFNFNYNILLNDLLEISVVMQKRKPQQHYHEDIYNDFYKDALGFKGYYVLDQTRGGQSITQKSPGELDIEICNEHRIPFSIFEAFKLDNKFRKEVIASHITKTIDFYDTSGHEVNFVVIYSLSEHFDNQWKKYKEFVAKKLNKHTSFSSEFLLKDFKELAFDKSDIKLAKSSHKRKGVDRILYHIFIDLN